MSHQYKEPYENPDIKLRNFILKSILTGVTVVGLVVGTGMYGCPQYNVYSQRMSGEATLAEANYSKQVEVQRAIAANQAAIYLAQAEITRARGVATANKIIGDSLKNNETYLRYLFVNNLEHTHNQIIYIPTEANLPILEATRRTPPSEGK